MKHKTYLYALICVCPLITIFFYVIYYFGYTYLSLPTTNIIAMSCILLMICSLISFHIKQPIYLICIVMQVVLCIIGSSENVILTTLYIFPMILSLFTQNIKFTIGISVFNIICYIISNYIKYTTLDPTNPMLGSFLLGVIYSFELAIIFISLFLYLKKINKMNKDLQKRNDEALNTQKDMINFCINSLSYHSPYLRIHTKNVAFYTKLILDNLTLDTKYKEDCYLGALVHDIGKIYISDSILDKPTKLTNEEFNTIKSHTTKGEELFKSIPYNAMDRETFNVCVNCIKYHHERLDGSGYLKITDIPLESRVIAIADVLDALLSYRSYKQPKTFEQSLEILKDENLFDQNIVNLIPTLKNQIIEYSEESNNELKNLFKYA